MVHGRAARHVTPEAEELIHLTGPDGRTCNRCGKPIIGLGFRYAVGVPVVVVGSDPLSSWVTSRQPTCTRPGRTA